MADDALILMSDPTYNEGGGSYRRICKIMEKDISRTWMLISDFSIILSEKGAALGELHLNHDGNVTIDNFESEPVSEGFGEAAIAVLSEELLELGWKKPKPSWAQTEEGIGFWERMHDKGYVDLPEEI